MHLVDWLMACGLSEKKAKVVGAVDQILVLPTGVRMIFADGHAVDVNGTVFGPSPAQARLVTPQPPA